MYHLRCAECDFEELTDDPLLVYEWHCHHAHGLAKPARPFTLVVNRRETTSDDPPPAGVHRHLRPVPHPDIREHDPVLA